MACGRCQPREYTSVQADGRGPRLQLYREHCRVLCQSRQEIQRAEGGTCRGAYGQTRVPSGTEGSPSEIWRGNGVPARGRRRRSQDYGTISTLRLEEAGGEVCTAGASLKAIGKLCNL